VTEYAWDHRNRLTKVTTRASSGGAITHEVEYSYDVYNRRLEKTVDADGAGSGLATSEYFVYDGENIAFVFDGSGSLTTRYLHGPATDQVLAEEGRGGSVGLCPGR